MRILLLVALLTAGCAGSPLAPGGAEFSYPSELQPVIDALDRDDWPHPLLGEPSGSYVRRHVSGIVIDPSLADDNLRARYNHGSRMVQWSPRYLGSGSAIGHQILAGLLLHEARHGAGHEHSCPDRRRDRTITEGGAVAVEVLWLEHHGLTDSADILRREFIGC